MKTEQTSKTLQHRAEETNGSSSNSNSQLIERHPVEFTPFEVIGSKETGYFAGFGNYRVTEKFETTNEVLNEIDNNDWNILLNVIAAMIDANNKFTNKTENQ